MNVHPDSISTFWALIASGLYVYVLYRAIQDAQWWRLKNARDLNVFLWAVLAVVFIWTMKTGYTTVLSLHLIGATLLTLMFGWAFAVIAMSLVVVVTTYLQDMSWSVLAVNTLLSGIVPVYVSHKIYTLTDRYLPNHFFIYIFLCAFFGAAIAIGAVIFTTTLVHYFSGAYTLDYLSYNYYSYSLLIIFPEAFLTGMLMTIFVLYRPQWVSSFDDRRYLRNH